MGMYTELIFGAALKKETPAEVINTLKHYCGIWDYSEEELSFKTKSGRNPLNNGGSYYFGVTNTTPQMWYDNIGEQWHVSSRTNLKNYEMEVESFLEWVRPYIESGSGTREFYAIVTHEESEIPTIYYLHESED